MRGCPVALFIQLVPSAEVKAPAKLPTTTKSGPDALLPQVTPLGEPMTPPGLKVDQLEVSPEMRIVGKELLVKGFPAATNRGLPKELAPKATPNKAVFVNPAKCTQYVPLVEVTTVP